MQTPYAEVAIWKHCWLWRHSLTTVGGRMKPACRFTRFASFSEAREPGSSSF